VQPDLVLPEAKLDQKLFPLLRGLIHGCSLLIPSKYFAEIGLFDVSLPTTQDYALWFKFMKVAQIKFSSSILIQSRVHPDQGTHKINTHLEECNELWSGFLSSLTDNEMSEIDTSPYIFRKNMAAFLLNTPYKKAAQLALTMTEETLNRIKISVVIPFRNRINWLIEALESVQKQTHQNYEIIIIDDGSTDELDFLFTFIKHDPRITYYRQNNQGPATARNAGIGYSKGRYIAFLDSDDLFNPSKLSEQLQYMEMLGFMWSHTSYSRIDLEGNIIGAVSSGSRNGLVYPGIIASCPIAMPTVMGLTTIFKQNLFPESLEIGEDVCLWITLARKYPLGGIDKVLSKVRIGPLTAAFNTQKQGIGLLNIALHVMKDENHSLHTRHLRSLLLDTANLFSEINSSTAFQISHSVSPPLVPNNQRIKRVFRLFSKGLSSLRVNGIRFTLQRVRSTLKGYLL
jgi:glycosyltransferase involved in cell wall biosynthesis